MANSSQDGVDKSMSARYGFSSVYIPVEGELAEHVLNFGDDNIPEDYLFIDKDKDFYGREDEPHCTVCYGLESEGPEAIMHILKDCDPFSVRLGRIDMFQRMNFDVLIIRGFSKILHDLHHKIMKATDTNPLHKFYEPHITLAYVQKGKGKELIDSRDFEDVELHVNKLLFSSKVGTKTIIKLGNKS